MKQNAVNSFPSGFNILHKSANPISHTGNVTETEILRLPVIKAIDFGNNSILRFYAAITLTSNGNNKRFRFKIGNQTIHIRDSAGNRTIIIDQYIQNRNSKNSQIIYGAAAGSSSSDFSTFNLDTKFDYDFTVTVQLNVATDIARLDVFWLGVIT